VAIASVSAHAASGCTYRKQRMAVAKEAAALASARAPNRCVRASLDGAVEDEHAKLVAERRKYSTARGRRVAATNLLRLANEQQGLSPSHKRARSTSPVYRAHTPRSLTSLAIDARCGASFDRLMRHTITLPAVPASDADALLALHSTKS